MIPCLSQVCSLNSNFENDIADYAAGDFRAVEIWLTKLEDFVKRQSVQSAAQVLSDHGVNANVASLQGGLLTSQDDARKVAWDLFVERLDLCRELQIRTIVVACDVSEPLSQTVIERVKTSLLRIASEADSRGVRAALEFHSRADFCNNLQTAASLVEEIGSASLGICLDVFHFWTGPSKIADLDLLRRENLFHVQLSDMTGVPREFATDAQRILPGDGDFDLPAVVEHLRRIQYDGCISVELMNPQIWQIPPRQFSEVALQSIQRLMASSDESV